MLHFLRVAASFWGLASPFTLYFSLFSANLTVGDRFDYDCLRHQAVQGLRRFPGRLANSPGLAGVFVLRWSWRRRGYFEKAFFGSFVSVVVKPVPGRGRKIGRKRGVSRGRRRQCIEDTTTIATKVRMPAILRACGGRTSGSLCAPRAMFRLHFEGVSVHDGGRLSQQGDRRAPEAPG